MTLQLCQSAIIKLSMISTVLHLTGQKTEFVKYVHKKPAGAGLVQKKNIYKLRFYSNTNIHFLWIPVYKMAHKDPQIVELGIYFMKMILFKL